MAEKNTLSILENIKKKMQKFDREPKRIDTVSGVDDEFEYIVPAKLKEQPEKKDQDENLSNKVEEAKLQDDEIEMKNIAAENTAKQNLPVRESLVHDDFDLDDLSDLDHYEPKKDSLSTNSVQTVNQNEFEEIPQAPIPSSDQELTVNQKSEEQKLEEHSDEDLNLNLDIDLEDDSAVLEQKTVEKNPKKNSKQFENDPLNDPLFGLELDDLIKNDLKDAEKEKPQPKLAEIKLTAEADDEEFLKNLEDDIAQIEKPEAEKIPEKALEPKKSKDELSDDLDLKDLDNLEKDMSTASEAVKKPQTNLEDEELKQKDISKEMDIIANEVVTAKEDSNLLDLDSQQIAKKKILPQ